MTPDQYYQDEQNEYLDSIVHNGEKVRIRDVRWRFEFTEENIPALMDIYKMWVHQHEYFLLEIRTRHPETYKLMERSWAALKCSKRGNDVYSNRVDQRLSTLKEAAKHLKNVTRSKKPDRQLRKTNMLYITLTCDPNQRSMANAWWKLGQEWNTFRSKLISKYGNVSILRCWEAYSNGYPHIHAFVIFHEHEFTAFHHTSRNTKNRDGSPKESFRILRRSKKDIAQMWSSFVDVLAVTEISEAVKNVLWYIGKNVTKKLDNINDKELLTYVATWYFRKQCFSMSKNLIDLINAKCIIQRESIIQNVQTTLEGLKFIIEIIFLGVMMGKVLEIAPNQWMETWDKRPDWLTVVSER